MAAFHEEHPDVALELQVTRHPFSFLGDYDGEALDQLVLKKEGTWRDRLLDYTGGDAHKRDQAMAGMQYAGKQVGINFDYNVYINRQPVDSQRMLLYCARQGRQEAYVSALSRRHFTQGTSGESASKRHTVLAAAAEAGIPRAEAAAFYDSDELRDVVWRSYGDMPRRGINAIPLFVFNVPEIGVEGGPLRPHAKGTSSAPPVVNGSMTAELFVGIFEQLWQAVNAARKANARPLPPPAAPPPPAAAPSAVPSAVAALIGRRVRLHGLKSKPALNGRGGVCARYDAARGRCVVRLDGATEPMLLRAENLHADAAAAAAGGVGALPASDDDQFQAFLKEDDELAKGATSQQRASCTSSRLEKVDDDDALAELGF